MQNCKTSAGTAAQQSSKCRLLFRQAALAAILLLCAVSSTQAQTTTNDMMIKKPTILSKIDSANIKQLKDVITFPSEIKRSFDGLIQAWYCQAKQKGQSEEKAFLETLDKLAAEVKRFAE